MGDEPLSVDIETIPITSTVWIKPSQTQNMLIWEYSYNCHLLALNTDFNSK